MLYGQVYRPVSAQLPAGAPPSNIQVGGTDGNQGHQNWELTGHLAEHGQGEETSALMTAFEAVGQEEAHHIFHIRGFTRELWIE